MKPEKVQFEVTLPLMFTECTYAVLNNGTVLFDAERILWLLGFSTANIRAGEETMLTTHEKVKPFLDNPHNKDFLPIAYTGHDGDVHIGLPVQGVFEAAYAWWNAETAGVLDMYILPEEDRQNETDFVFYESIPAINGKTLLLTYFSMEDFLHEIKYKSGYVFHKLKKDLAAQTAEFLPDAYKDWIFAFPWQLFHKIWWVHGEAVEENDLGNGGEVAAYFISFALDKRLSEINKEELIAAANKRKSEGKTFAKMPKEPELKYFNDLIKTFTDTGQSAYSPKQWLQLFFSATRNY